jgi:hypothetical protein
MQAFGVLLLAAATAGDGVVDFHEPGVHLKQWLRPHAVVDGHVPGPPPYTAATLAGGGPGAAPGRRFVTTKSQIYFLDPNGMQVGWQNGTGMQGERTYLPAQLTVPARYNFNQGYIYRLKITNIPGRPMVSLYPTIEVAPTTPTTDAYLAHNAIPLQWTAEDFDQVVDGGNFVTKVIYLPDPKYQELAISGVETLVSTRLEPGVDPILEADRRGTILLIARLGAIDLEMPLPQVSGPAVGAPIVGAPTELPPGALPPSGVVLPPGAVAPGGVVLPPGAVAPGGMVVPPPAQPTVILDNPPANGVPAAPVPSGTAAPAPAPAPAPGVAPVPAPPVPGEGVKPRTAALAPPVYSPDLAPAPGS